MENAYDLKVLVDRLKENGLDLAEDAAKEIVEVVIQFIIDSAQGSDNKVDDILVGLLLSAKPWVMEQIDKIDNEIG